MAGANNKALKHAGMTAREVEVFRASGGKSLRATVTAAKHSPTVQGANADFRAKAAAGLKSMAERKAAVGSNLLVGLCGEQAAQPGVNTGTLYT